MELNINEFEEDDDIFLEEYLQEHEENIEENPKNVFSKKETRKQVQVHFEEHTKPMNQSIPKQYAKMVRPKVQVEEPKVSYDDILLKMGMFVVDGKLHFKQNQKQNQNNFQDQINPENSYIYNKYFSNDLSKAEPNVRVPKNLQEYRDMLIHDIIQKQRIKQIKSTKLFLPTQNIHFAPNTNPNMNLNRLFHFSNR